MSKELKIMEDKNNREIINGTNNSYVQNGRFGNLTQNEMGKTKT